MDEARASIDRTVARIPGEDAAAVALARRAMDRKTKPRGSLGRLEDIAIQIAGILGAMPRELSAAVVVVAADHGVAAEGVSAYPQQVTGQMLVNFTSGGAAVCVLARQVGARLVVVDAGVASDVEVPGVIDRRLGAGTANITQGPAMTADQAIGGLSTGIALVEGLSREHVGLIGLGEMGIANSTAAAALSAALLTADPARVCGRGTGIDDDGLARKVDAVRRALDANGQAIAAGEPVGILAALGGFEIAVLTGAILGAAAARIPVLLDGFISTSAALVAARIAPLCVGSMLASHRSLEPGHGLLLEALRLTPILDLAMRLGEGSGAALAIPIVNASLSILEEMATFDEAGVTDAGA